MSRRLLVGTGWKMNLTAAATRHYASRLREQLSGIAHDDIDIFVLPPFTSLHAAHEAFAGAPVGIGGQNMHWDAAGAWTGEISADMLTEAGCRYVELAHSERLACFGETYELVRLKVDAALRAGLTPILCIGETAEDKQAGRSDAALARQVRTVLDGRPVADVTSVILAYEPRWAIGQAEAATPDYVAERHASLRALVRDSYGAQAAADIRIIYGGSVTPRNGPDLIAIADVDGLFIGRAAWTAEGLAAMIRIVSDAAARRKSGQD
jgi:triosephosphate isomerase